MVKTQQSTSTSPPLANTSHLLHLHISPATTSIASSLDIGGGVVDGIIADAIVVSDGTGGGMPLSSGSGSAPDELRTQQSTSTSPPLANTSHLPIHHSNLLLLRIIATSQQNAGASQLMVKTQQVLWLITITMNNGDNTTIYLHIFATAIQQQHNNPPPLLLHSRIPPPLPLPLLSADLCRFV